MERWLAELTRKQFQCGVHRSTAELETDIVAFIEAHNENPKPYRWVKPADEILASVKRFCQKTQQTLAKFADHLPLYRQSQILARSGIDLQRSTLVDWAGTAAFHLAPVVDQFAEHLKGSGKPFMDETTAPVLEPGPGRTKTGFLWALARDDQSCGRPTCGFREIGAAISRSRAG